jgi:hypothetical protein
MVALEVGTPRPSLLRLHQCRLRRREQPRVPDDHQAATRDCSPVAQSCLDVIATSHHPPTELRVRQNKRGNQLHTRARSIGEQICDTQI